MKKRETLIYTILLGSSLLLCPLRSTAQEKKTATTEEKATVPLYQGTYVGLDVFGLGSKIFGSDFTSAEVSVEVNLKNRFIPIIEIGYGHTDTTDDETNIHYKASAPYFRIGMNYNILFKKPHLPGYAYGGIRYGFTSFTYDVDGSRNGRPDLGKHHRSVYLQWGKKQCRLGRTGGRAYDQGIQEFLYGAFCALPGTHQHEENRKYRTLVYPRIRQEQS